MKNSFPDDVRPANNLILEVRQNAIGSFDPPRDRRLTGLLWRLRAKTDSRVEPIAVGRRQWLEDNGTPLICIARQEGEPISLT